MAQEHIRIQHAAIDEVSGGEIVLRGVVRPEHIHLLQTDDYQREQLPWSTIAKMMDAMRGTVFPDIDLGMRGANYDIDKKTGDIVLKHAVYIIDGLQRVTAALALHKEGKVVPRLGAMIRFNTNYDKERKLFEDLNVKRNKLSPNVLLRNKKHDFPSIEMLYNLTNDSSFVLHNRVSWQNHMSRSQLLTARTYTMAIGTLHRQFGPGGSSRLEDTCTGLEKIMSAVGKNTLRGNTRTFYDLIDSCWGIRRTAYRELATHLRGTFIEVLAMLLCRHTTFWRDKRLFIERDLVAKFGQFPITDNEVIRLSSAGGQATQLLYSLMLNHINSGKRTKRLTAATMWDEHKKAAEEKAKQPPEPEAPEKP